MALVHTVYIPAAPPAMGLPKKHLYEDCPHIRRAVVRQTSSENRLVQGLPLCKACEKRLLRDQAKAKEVS